MTLQELITALPLHEGLKNELTTFAQDTKTPIDKKIQLEQKLWDMYYVYYMQEQDSVYRDTFLNMQKEDSPTFNTNLGKELEKKIQLMLNSMTGTTQKNTTLDELRKEVQTLN